MNNCSYCEVELEYVMNGEEHYCSKECQESNKAPTKAEEYSRNRHLIHSRDRFRCSYCGRSSISDGVRLHLDHIIPALSGGDDIAGNLITACESCNCSKGSSNYPIDLINEIKEEVKKRNKEFNINPTMNIRFKLG